MSTLLHSLADSPDWENVHAFLKTLDSKLDALVADQGRIANALDGLGVPLDTSALLNNVHGIASNSDPQLCAEQADDLHPAFDASCVSDHENASQAANLNSIENFPQRDDDVLSTDALEPATNFLRQDRSSGLPPAQTSSTLEAQRTAEVVVGSNTVKMRSYQVVPRDGVKVRRKSAEELPGFSIGRRSSNRERNVVSLARISKKINPQRLGGLCTRIAKSLPWTKYAKQVILIDLFGALLLLTDSVIVPYFIAWDSQKGNVFMVVACLSASFWTIDLSLRFVISELEEKEEARNATVMQTAKSYLKGWFVLDFALVVLDWFSTSAELAQQKSSATIAKLARILKVTRVIRLLAVIRAGRLSHFPDAFMHKVRGYAAFVEFILSLTKLVLFLLWIHHLGACSWALFEGKARQDTSSSFQMEIVGMQPNYHTYDDLPLTYQYFVAYYWSLTSMFSGASSLFPRSTVESVYSIFTVLFGFLFGATVISSMAAMLMEVYESNREHTNKMRDLQRFMRQHSITPILRVMIQRQATERLRPEIRLAEENVEAISCLSVELRNQLHQNMFTPVLFKHRLWLACDYVDMDVINFLSECAVTCNIFKPGELVFKEEDLVEQSYTLVWGKMMYSLATALPQSPSSPKAVDEAENSDKISRTPSCLLQYRRNDPRVSIHLGQTVCEIALWVEWTTLGYLEAVSICELFVTSAKGLQEVVPMLSTAAQTIVCGYSEALAHILTSEKYMYLGDTQAETDYDSIISFMPQESRVQMSRPALKVLKGQGFMSLSSDLLGGQLAAKGLRGLSKDQISKLESEVMEGKCNVIQDESGIVQRVVRLVVLQLTRPDGLVCVQVGEVNEDGQTVLIHLPGRKLRMQETLKDCMEHLLGKHFHAFRSRPSLSYGTIDVQTKPSKEYGISTKYIRRIVEATIPHSRLVASALTRECTWGDKSIECFASKDSEDIPPTLGIFAWMTVEQSQELERMGEHGERMVLSWMAEFSQSELEYARRSAILL